MEYPTIKIKHQQTGEISYCYLVGTYLAISRTKTNWEIWNKHGVTLFRNIESQEDAIEISSWINEIYQTYFSVWDIYPELDVFSLTMWTVPEGLKLFETIEHMRTLPRITVHIVQGIYSQATGRKYYWNYMKECRA